MCLTAALAGCGGAAGGDAGGPAFEVADSAGVAIARNAVPASPGVAMLARVEDLRLGVREGPPELELYSVRDVIPGPEGEVYAAFQNDGEIRVYGANGGWLRTIGRTGEGPGEFRAITWIGIFGDTLMAFDPRLYRMTLFSLDGDLIDTWAVRKGSATIMPRARTTAGWLVDIDDFEARPRYDIGVPARNTSRVALVSSVIGAIDELPTGTPPWDVMDVVLEHPAWTTWGIGQADGVVFGRRALWDPEDRHAFGPDGRIYVSRATRYAIDVYEPDGALVRRITRQHEPVPITDELIGRYRRAVMTHYDTTSTVGEAGLDLVAAAEQHIALPNAGYLPVLGEITVGDDGSIWVERPDLVDDPLLLEWTRAGYQPEAWDVFDADGRFAGTVEMPARSTVHVVGRDWVIVTERDELDVQYIVRYRLNR